MREIRFVQKGTQAILNSIPMWLFTESRNKKLIQHIKNKGEVEIRIKKLKSVTK